MTDVHPLFQPKKTAYRGEDVEAIWHERNRYRKQARKLQEQLNRQNKAVPSAVRIWNLTRIAVELEAEAERLRDENVPHSDPDGLDRDALFLHRLEYDLITLRMAMKQPVRGQSVASSKYDPRQWPRGERP